MGTIFVAGVYGVGKSTLCNALSKALNIPAFSAGDLISGVNGEKYGANKAVKNKENNQEILADIVSSLLLKDKKIILAGHFCIFDRNNNVDCLPESVFSNLEIERIILLEANVDRIVQNLTLRDGRRYSRDQLINLLREERSMAERIAQANSYPLYVHQMSFNDSDVSVCGKNILS